MEQQRVFAEMLGATDGAEALASTSGYFVEAMIGDPKAREAFAESASLELGRADAQLVDFPGTFQRMDARVEALRKRITG